MFALLQTSGATEAAANTVSTAAAAAPTGPSAAELAAATAEATKEAAGEHITLMSMVQDASVVSQIVLVLLVLMAIYALSLLFEKTIVMRNVKSKITGFMAQFKKAKTPDEAAQLVAKLPDSVMKKMFTAGWNEVQTTREMGLYSMKTGDHTLARVQTAMDIEQNKGIEELGSNMTFLASIGANAPFIGLFGTVFGIMYSFIGIVESNTTSLTSVAPGIAEALLATAAGLLAAIPAVLIYNFTSKAIGSASGAYDDFKAEFLSLLSRDMDKQG